MLRGPLPAQKPNLNVADRMDFLVINEIFDNRERKKTPLDFHLIFPDWHEPDIRAFVRRDKNHPSVIAWSFGDEVGGQYTNEAGAALAKKPHDMVREKDPTRHRINELCQAGYGVPPVLDILSLN
ncbi:glycoside hydrolase family 2 TIM barrel-domain containing protein [Spirosoma fluminis]